MSITDARQAVGVVVVCWCVVVWLVMLIVSGSLSVDVCGVVEVVICMLYLFVCMLSWYL